MTTHHKYQLAILGGILTHFRHAKHLTNAELASRLGKPESFVTDYESGEYCLDLAELVDIADALGIDMVELVNIYQQKIWPTTSRKNHTRSSTQTSCAEFSPSSVGSACDLIFPHSAS